MEPGDLESRVAALERQVRDLSGRVQLSEQDAAAARVLAGAADRDVGELRGDLREFRQATAASFNALRVDFVDLRTHVDEGFTEMRRGFTEMRRKFDVTAAGQQHIVDLLEVVGSDRRREPNE
jgi:uncharacterized protein with von Willebrand factor type A (vWA) domain